MQSGQITFYKIRDNKFQLDLTITLRLYLAIFYKRVLNKCYILRILSAREIMTFSLLIKQLTINIYFYSKKKKKLNSIFLELKFGTHCYVTGLTR